MSHKNRTVAYLIDDLGYGGAQKQLTLLACELPRPFRPVIISMSQNVQPFASMLDARGIRVIALRRRSGLDVWRLLELRRALGSTRADIIHGFLDAANTYAYLAARIPRRPVILSLRNERLLVSGFRARMLSWMFRHADRVMVNSRKGQSLLVDRLGVLPTSVSYVRNWIAAPSSAGHGSDVPREGRIVGNIGRFSTQKQLHLLIDALAIVRADIPDARLLLMGAGAEKGKLRDQVGRVGLTDSVEFLDPQPDVETVLRRFDCFVMPSAYEGMPNAAIEALACGVPLITSAAGDVADLVVEGETGSLLRDLDPSTLARSIIGVLRGRDLRLRARTAGPALVERTFSLKSAMEKIVPIYQELLGK